MAKLLKQRKKSATGSEVPRISAPIMEEFARFIEYHPVDRVNRNLRKMLFEFLSYAGPEALYFEDLVYDLEGLFELLDTVEAELKGSG